MKTSAKLWLGLAVLVVLSPLGLLLPKYFKSGTAWGEWGNLEIQKLAGYIPKGFSRLSGLWKAPLPNYGVKGGNWLHSSALYIACAAIGITIVALLAFLIGKILSRKGD
ncbi:MAG: cobalamin biosynthesis protein [Candidatus Omnitrophica bacterium]|nr:cobalamin biosynthesis protein [Candidatus Omnitrophota bacterium]